MSEASHNINRLINRCLQDEQAAFYEVYNRYYHMMYNTAYRMLNNSAEAEDMMQEAFITAFEKLKTFQRKSKYNTTSIPFAAWLKRIVVNKTINYIRREKSIPFTDIEIVHQIGNPEDEHTWKDKEVERILAGLQRLKPNYKLILTLYLIEGYDYEEIGNIMQLSYANVRTLISRAKAKLKAELTGKTQQIT